MISEVNGTVFKFSRLISKDDPGLAEYDKSLNSQGESPAEPELDVSDELLVVGTSPRILQLVRSRSDRSTPSMSSDSSNDTIEPFGDLNLDDVDDMVSNERKILF